MQALRLSHFNWNGYLNRYNNLEFVQKASLSFLITYLLFLFILFFFYNIESENDLIIGDRVADFSNEKGIYMEQLDRLEYKDNIKKWTLRAESAFYSELAGKAKFSSPLVKVYDVSNFSNPTIISSKTADLEAKDGQVEMAVLRGDVRLTNSSGAVVESQLAEYYSADAKVIFPQRATITGRGYKIEGDRLIVDTNQSMLDFYTNIFSIFDSTANFKSFSALKKIGE